MHPLSPEAKAAQGIRVLAQPLKVRLTYVYEVDLSMKTEAKSSGLS